MHRRLGVPLIALTLLGSVSWMRLHADGQAAGQQDAGRPATRLIVIDPGHGGDDTGTVSAAGVAEKDITLAVASRLRAALERQPGLAAVLTRTGDQRMPLRDRTALANTRNASVFLSLHVNASAGEALRGAEFSVLTADDTGGVALDTPGTPVPTIGGSTRVLTLVPWERAALRHRNESVRLARMLAATFESAGQLSPRGIQSAPLAVLVGTGMPAVMADLGYLTSPEEAARLGSPEGQDALAGLLRDAVLQFLAEAPAP